MQPIKRQRHSLVSNSIRLVVLLVAIMTSPTAFSQTLEFASGDGNPTGNGPVSSATIRFRNNTNDPADNTFGTYTPALSATFQLTNQQYTNHPQNTDGNAGTANNPASVIGWYFGGNSADPIFSQMNLLGGAAKQ